MSDTALTRRTLTLAQLLYNASTKQQQHDDVVTTDDVYEYVKNHPNSLNTRMTTKMMDNEIVKPLLSVLPFHYVLFHEDCLIKYSNWTHKEVCI